MAPWGRPEATGSAGDPHATPQAARDALREQRPAGQAAVVHIAPGRYRFAQPLLLEPRDSRTRWVGARSDDGAAAAVFDGGIEIADWTPTAGPRGPIWSAPAPQTAEIRSLWTADGQRLARTRRPRSGTFRIGSVDDLAMAGGHMDALFDGSSTFSYEGSDLADLADAGRIDILISHYWVQERMPVLSVDNERRSVSSTRRSIFALRDDIDRAPARYTLENVRDALGEEPGEWYHDLETGRLLYAPRQGEDPDRVRIIAPATEQLLIVRGRPGDPVVEVAFEGVSFEHTDWSMPGPADYGLLRRLPRIPFASAPQSAMDVPGVISVEHALRFSLLHAIVAHSGGYALDLREGVRDAWVSHCRLRDLGAGGIAVSGAASHRSAGTTRGAIIEDCDIGWIGRVFAAGAGILIRHSGGNVVRHNRIHHTKATGISCGWVWGYRESVAHTNVIEANHLHDIGDGSLSDLGGIYLLGVSPGTVVRGNVVHRIRCANYGGWCIYLDEGASHILIEDNLAYDAGAQVLHQHFGRGNVVRNNVLAHGRHGQVCVTRPESHVSFTFERNIVVGSGSPAFVGEGPSRPDLAQVNSDSNLFWDEHRSTVRAGEGRTDARAAGGFRPIDDEWLKLGRDQHSVVADPRLRLPVDGRVVSPVVDAHSVKSIGFIEPAWDTVGPRQSPASGPDPRDSRTTNSACGASTVEATPSRRSAMTVTPARSPIACTSWPRAASRGLQSWQSTESSQASTDTCSGTETPVRASCPTPPSAMRSSS
ncbi:right-handed parallel beta-helix repeat-containing protein [Microbacterium sp. BK668]|uniref:right-handed parallel beta-helix repeat-containing protein n=1 Tax=Microbacterium sp. BK668 TaxID=2512118 RepID=UPI001414D7C3|nr:right-handed parallel beta-helix repeat-containing protein [Microbacterium sp. BK668]